MPDDATIVEGDAGFLGMASRLNPLQLQPGMVQYVENMRLDRGVAQTRKGAKRLAESIGNIGEALTLPFQLAPDKSISSITRGGVGNLMFPTLRLPEVARVLVPLDSARAPEALVVAAYRGRIW